MKPKTSILPGINRIFQTDFSKKLLGEKTARLLSKYGAMTLGGAMERLEAAEVMLDELSWEAEVLTKIPPTLTGDFSAQREKVQRLTEDVRLHLVPYMGDSEMTKKIIQKYRRLKKKYEGK